MVAHLYPYVIYLLTKIVRQSTPTYMESDQAIHYLLHTLWTKAVGTENYDKSEWKRMSAFIYAHLDRNKIYTRSPRNDQQEVERKPVI